MSLPGSPLDRLRHSPRLALASCMLLAALALWLVARMAWTLWPRPESDTLPVPPVGNVPVATAPASVSRFHLFGVTPQDAAGQTPGAPASTTGLILRGTLADRDARAGVAVIDGAGNGERAFRAGEEVMPGVRLQSVYADHIVLSRGGVEETLRLTRDTNLDPTRVVRPVPAVSKGSATVTSHAPLASGTVVAAAPAGSGQLQRTIARLRDNPAELMQRVRVVPVLDNGKLAGVRIATSGADAALLSQAGLQADDIVTAVNGQRLDSIERGQQILSGLGSADSVRITVLRNGKPTDLTVALK